MISPIQLCDVAKLHQSDVEREVASKQSTKQAQIHKTAKSGTLKRFIMMSFYSSKDGQTTKTREAFSG
jgi:hypothetical protein